MHALCKVPWLQQPLLKAAAEAPLQSSLDGLIRLHKAPNAKAHFQARCTTFSVQWLHPPALAAPQGVSCMMLLLSMRT